MMKSFSTQRNKTLDSCPDLQNRIPYGQWGPRRSESRWEDAPCRLGFCVSPHFREGFAALYAYQPCHGRFMEKKKKVHFVIFLVSVAPNSMMAKPGHWCSQPACRVCA